MKLKNTGFLRSETLTKLTLIMIREAIMLKAMIIAMLTMKVKLYLIKEVVEMLKVVELEMHLHQEVVDLDFLWVVGTCYILI